jgi:L-fuculose-phosphate aldolase
MSHEVLRAEIVATARKMNALGINQGTSGNLSARWGDRLLLSPSGVDYEAMTPDDVVAMDFDGNWDAAGGLEPTTEWRIHRDLLRERPELGAVLHAHPRYATALACHGREIPAFHYMVAVAGGDSIRCAPYATFGTEELSRSAVQALEGRKACLLANHGMIACGENLAAALALAVEVETLAAQYWHALQLGEPTLLSDEEMARVLDLFADYGS